MRTIAWMLWDMQNVGPSAAQAAQMGTAIKKAAAQREPKATLKGRVYYSPTQARIAKTLNGWRPAEIDGDCDEELANDARSLAGQNPGSLAVFLVAKDGDYVALIKDLKAKGAQVYLIAPREGASRQLKDAAGQGNVVTLALP